MQIALPEYLEACLQPQDVLLDLAVGMYASRRITLGRGAEITGLTQLEFQRELGRRRIPTHYDLDDLAVDLQAVREMTRA
jgi:predicted HTH domain antitoxin